jgi:hypothetical protein
MVYASLGAVGKTPAFYRRIARPSQRNPHTPPLRFMPWEERTAE